MERCSPAKKLVLEWGGQGLVSDTSLDKMLTLSVCSLANGRDCIYPSTFKVVVKI